MDWTPQFVCILRPLGAFMLVLGVVGIAAGLAIATVLTLGLAPVLHAAIMRVPSP